MSPMPRRLESSVLAIVCLAGLASAAAGAEPPAPGQVVGYANADRSGASQVWALPPDKPYLYVPTIPAALNGKVAAVETGPEVGVALFRQPYFTTRDRGCQPALGTARQPRLAWLGATARFAPAPAGQPEAPPPEAAKDGYGSLIVYRADLGPPPGALVLDRRVTLGLNCPNPVQQTVYNRIFVPVAEAPEAERCFDLVGNYPGSNKPFALDFVESDRLVLMMPGDMSERYARIRHDITVTLFEGLSCKGPSATLDSRARLGRDIRLAQLEFRNRARSIRLSYDYGNADAFLVRRDVPAPTPAPTPLPDTAAKAPDSGSSRLGQALAAQPIEDPAVGRTVPLRDPTAPSAPVSAPGQGPADRPAAPTADSQIAAPTEPEAPDATAAEARAQAAPAPKPGAASSAPAGQALAQPAVRTPAAAAPAVEPSAKSESAVPVGEPVTDTTAARPPRQSAAAAPTARTIPKLSPRMTPPGPQTAAVPTAPKTFPFPVQGLYRLNLCLNWQSGCGQPAATAWCRAKGYSEALDWTADKNIGANFPTVILGDREVCARAGCDGFKEITCKP